MFAITSKLSLNDVLDIECNVLEKRMRMKGGGVHMVSLCLPKIFKFVDFQRECRDRIPVD